MCCCYSPDGSLCALGSDSGQVSVFEAETGQLVQSFPGASARLSINRVSQKWLLTRHTAHADVIRSLTFSADSSMIITGVCYHIHAIHVGSHSDRMHSLTTSGYTPMICDDLPLSSLVEAEAVKFSASPVIPAGSPPSHHAPMVVSSLPLLQTGASPSSRSNARARSRAQHRQDLGPVATAELVVDAAGFGERGLEFGVEGRSAVRSTGRRGRYGYWKRARWCAGDGKRGWSSEVVSCNGKRLILICERESASYLMNATTSLGTAVHAHKSHDDTGPCR